MSTEWIIGKRKVGVANPCWIVAEIGANHDGNPERAAELVKTASEAGADAVKFQTYSAEELVSDSDRITSWGPPGKKIHEPVGEMFRRITLPRENHKELFDLANSLGLVAFSTPYTPEAVEFLDSLNVPVFKIASSDVGNAPLLQAVASTSKPIILSAGKATLAEIDLAIETLEHYGSKEIALLHCVSTYPTQPEDCNLNVLKTLQHTYPGFIVGFSDHSQGTLASSIAVALGAKIIEKHITYNREAEGPDHWFSLDPDDLCRLVEHIRQVESMMGSGRKRILPSEAEGRKLARPSIVAATDIPAGTIISREMLKICRPGTGLEPSLLPVVIGRTSRCSIARNQVITWECI